MPQRTYLGPATELDGKPVPADGLKVNYSDAVVAGMIQRGHVFEGKDGDVLRLADLRAAAPATTAQVPTEPDKK